MQGKVDKKLLTLHITCRDNSRIKKVKIGKSLMYALKMIHHINYYQYEYEFQH
jgi:hypothetical protein